jgi:transcriptional antiterminator RfaH
MNRVAESAWFAIQTRVSSEKIAEYSLHQLGSETMLPLLRRDSKGWRARRNPTKALFPGYLFASLDFSTQLRAAAHAHGVVRVVSAGERPLPVATHIIESLRTRMDNSGCVALDVEPFRRGEIVRIIAGPFEGWQGVFDGRLGDAQRLVILLETLHQGRLIVDADWVERSEAA